MALSRFQFRLSTLLWITLAVACWFGGLRFERWQAQLRMPSPRPVPARSKVPLDIDRGMMFDSLDRNVPDRYSPD
jgi:hypothetical protein